MIKNRKGFTLVELLAVITILGILMIVAIPAVSRTIENSRRNTFLSTAKTYVNAVREGYAADQVKYTEGSAKKSVTILADLKCFAVRISTTSATSGNALVAYNNAKELVNQGGVSSWGNADVYGWVVGAIGKEKGNDGQWRQAVTYYVNLVDIAGHGINFGGVNGKTDSDNLTRGDVLPADAKLRTNSTTVSGTLTTTSIGATGTTAPTFAKSMFPGHGSETGNAAQCVEATIE